MLYFKYIGFKTNNLADFQGKKSKMEKKNSFHNTLQKMVQYQEQTSVANCCQILVEQHPKV